MQASIGASSLMRSLLANPSVPLELVPALRKALVAGTSEEVTMRNLPLGPLAGPPFAEEFEFVDWFGKPMESRERAPDESRLARVTTYWPEEGDRHTRRALSSTGVRLRDGHCAVDPRVIPYGSVVTIRGVGEFVAVDTGPAVVSRRAARQLGRNRQERSALVVDIFCSSRSKANAIEASLPEFAFITWSR